MFVIARNATGRPTLQHAVNPEEPRFTVCGVAIWMWSRAYQQHSVEQIICKTCKKVMEDE